MAQIAKRAILSVVAACAVATGVVAAENQDQHQQSLGRGVLIGQGVVCDSAKQIKHFSALLEGASVEEAVNLVNREADNPAACAVVMAAFIPGKELAEADRNGRSLKIVEITIVAIPLHGRWHVVSPTKQYAAFRLKGIEI